MRYEGRHLCDDLSRDGGGELQVSLVTGKLIDSFEVIRREVGGVGRGQDLISLEGGGEVRVCLEVGADTSGTVDSKPTIKC